MTATGGSGGFITLDLIHRLPVGILIFDDAGRLVSTNQAAERLLGHVFVQGATRESVIDGLGPGCEPLVGLRPGERQVVHAGGLLIEVSAQHLGGTSVLWVVADRSEELRLRAQLAEHASLLAHSHEAFLVVCSSGRIRYANAVAELLMRSAPGGLIAASLLDHQRPTSDDYEPSLDPAQQVQAQLAFALVSDGAVHYHAWTRRQDGSEFPAEITLRPYRISTEVVLLMSLRDESKRMQHLQDLLEAKATAEAANRAKSAFMAITSHELRTPLASIIGFCDLLLLDHGHEPGDMPQHLRLIKESSRSLFNIINDILDLSKIEAKTLEITVEVLDPDHVVNLVAELWQPRAAAKQITLVRSPSTGRRGRFFSDPLRLRQVLDNLVSNALKFTDQGRIEIGLEHHDDSVVFRVSDNGAGIPVGVHDQLFRPFWQLADHRTRREGGTGLGLYICKQIAQLLGGTVWLESSGDSGSTFCLRLPRNIEGQSGMHRVISDTIFRDAE